MTITLQGPSVASQEDLARQPEVRANWIETASPRPTIYHIAAHFNEKADDEDESVTVYLVELPGVVSDGDDIEDALESIKDAFQCAVEVYRDHGEPVPWRDDEPEEGDDIVGAIMLDG